MPVKQNPIKEVKCICGKNTTVDVIPATAYCKLTKFVCSCNRIYHIIDYMNGCMCYYLVSNMVCPFCGEGDFDSNGLKHHLIYYCQEFANIEALNGKN